MALSDPIADMLTRIRNASRAGHESCTVSKSKLKTSILEILKDQGFIKDYQPVQNGKFEDYKIVLNYTNNNKPVIKEINTVSKPGKRVYITHDEIRPYRNNIGIVIVSTSKGVMTGKKAKKLNVGGEVICRVF